MSKTIVVLPDPHAHPEHNNDRALWAGSLIKDVKPDIVVNLGDMFDMPSLSNYDKGKASFHGRNYQKDIDAGLDFDEKLWYNIRKGKRKMPYSVFLEGNHEHRLKKALDLQPELEGERYGASFSNYDLNRNYKEVVEYSGGTPGLYTVEGINFGHYIISGVMGRPIGGEHHAYSLLTKNFESCVVGHSHLLDFSTRTKTNGEKIMGLVAGCFQDYDAGWAGNCNTLWWRGLCILHNVENGRFDLETVSIGRLEKEYA